MGPVNIVTWLEIDTITYLWLDRLDHHAAKNLLFCVQPMHFQAFPMHSHARKNAPISKGGYQSIFPGINCTQLKLWAFTVISNQLV